MQILETFISVLFFLLTELRDSLQSSPSDRMAVVSKKIAYLGKVYVHSERYFPLGKNTLIYSAQILFAWQWYSLLDNDLTHMESPVERINCSLTAIGYVWSLCYFVPYPPPPPPSPLAVNSTMWS